MTNRTEALHIEVIHALPGRLRLHLEHLPNDETLALQGMRELQWNARLQTLLIRYDTAHFTQEQVLLRVAAAYARACKATLIHIRHCEESSTPLAPSAFLALGGMAVDGALTIAGSTLTTYTRWLSLITTLAAVFEHGYHELQTRGSFDPEVMSIVYLFNAIGKTTTVQSSLVAWLVTFGRHLIPRAPREQAYLARESGGEMLMTAVRCEDAQSVVASLLDGGVKALSKKESRIMGL